MGRWLAVWVIALAMRHGLSPNDAAEALSKSYSHRSGGWRWAVIGDAQVRNNRKARRKVDA